MSIAAGLGAFIDGWVELAKLTSYDDVRAARPRPWASVNSGAAGHAFALWYVGTRRSPDALPIARKWARAANRGAEVASGLAGPELRGFPRAGSATLGRAGLALVDALVAHALAKPAARDRALASVAATVRRARRAPAEFNFGVAGTLTAALMLHRETGDRAMRAFADELAVRLLASPPIADPGFAHGQAGVQHALLAWSQLPGAALPASFVATIVQPTDDEVIARTRLLAGSWCNGLAGLVLLWVKAFEITGDERWRERARTAMRRVLADPGNGLGSLCCGTGGQAYAALALARVDAAEDWRARGEALCLHALTATPEYGVFKGLPGLVCLAVDLLGGAPRFPLVEV